MILFPAIDLQGGRCVRLIRGEFGTAHKVADDPLAAALSFKEAGARYLHMVDLDAARTGECRNRDAILDTARKSGLLTQAGGGVRTLREVDDYLSGGIHRVVLGSSALRDPGFVREAVKRYPGRIAVGIDARDGKVSVDGWLNTSETDYIHFARTMEDIGVEHLIFTDISRDGTLEGPNFEALAALKEAVSCAVVASGGIKDIGHIRALCAEGYYGAICGKALYSGTLSLKEALAAVRGE